MRIDAHQHYWKISRGDYGWITTDIGTLYRDFLPGDLESDLTAHDISKTVVVQAAPTIAETEFLLALSENQPSIAGVVGWLDLVDPDHEEQFRRLSQHPKFVGFRVMIQDMEDPTEILEPDVVDAFQRYAQMDVPVDLLVKANQIPVLIKLLEAVPGLRGVIDHIAKPNIALGDYEPWASQMTELASYPSIYCKLSGMVTEADHRHWKSADFAQYVDHVIQSFGATRVMYGSDWPVCLMAASYDDVWRVANENLPATLTEAERAAIFGNNAVSFYKLKA